MLLESSQPPTSEIPLERSKYMASQKISQNGFISHADSSALAKVPELKEQSLPELFIQRCYQSRHSDKTSQRRYMDFNLVKKIPRSILLIVVSLLPVGQCHAKTSIGSRLQLSIKSCLITRSTPLSFHWP